MFLFLSSLLFVLGFSSVAHGQASLENPAADSQQSGSSLQAAGR